MRARLARTADGWWVDAPGGLARLAVGAATTGALLADQDPLTAAVRAARAPGTADPRPAVPGDNHAEDIVEQGRCRLSR